LGGKSNVILIKLSSVFTLRLKYKHGVNVGERLLDQIGAYYKDYFIDAVDVSDKLYADHNHHLVRNLVFLVPDVLLWVRKLSKATIWHWHFGHLFTIAMLLLRLASFLTRVQFSFHA